MEIGLKERLIGAAVLVILGVILIPLFLKGPAPDSNVTQSVTLPPSTSTAAQEYQMDLAGNASGPASPAASAVTTPAAPVAVPPAGPGATPVEQPASTTAKTLSQKTSRSATSTSTQGSTPAPTKGDWVVQAGSYGNQANAEKVAHQLQARGYHASVSQFRKNGRTYFRVRVGPYVSRADAEHALAGVAKAYGGKPVVVPNT